MPSVGWTADVVVGRGSVAADVVLLGIWIVREAVAQAFRPSTAKTTETEISSPSCRCRKEDGTKTDQRPSIKESGMECEIAEMRRFDLDTADMRGGAVLTCIGLKSIRDCSRWRQGYLRAGGERS